MQAEFHRRAEQSWVKMTPPLDGLSHLPAGSLVRLNQDGDVAAVVPSSSGSAAVVVGSTSRMAQSTNQVGI